MADCINILKDPEIQKKLFGDKQVSEEAIRRMAQDIEAIKKNSSLDPSGGTYQSRVSAYLKDQQAQSQIEKGVIANARRLQRDNLTYLKQPAFYEKPVEGIIGKISGAVTLGEGARDSAWARITGLTNEHLNFLNYGLEKAGVMKLVQSGQLDHDIKVAWEAIKLGNQIPDNISKEARDAAQVFHDTYKSLFVATRNAGVPVRDLPNFTGSVIDDIKKLRATPFDEWAAKVREFGIDKEKTFGVAAGDASAENKILKAIYDGKTIGNMSADSKMPDFNEELRYGASYSQKLSASRQLRLTNASAESAYNDAFGRGNVLENATYDIQRKSKMIGASMIFGPNPEQAILGQNGLIDKMISQYNKDERFDLAGKLQNGRTQIAATVKEMTGKGSIPGVSPLADTVDKLKTVQSLSKLGWAGVNSLPNLAVAASQLTSLNGKNMFMNMADMAFEWLKQLPMEERARQSRAAGYVLEDSNIGAFGSAENWNTPGLGSRLMKLQFKLNGMDAVNSMQNAFAKLHMEDVAENSTKSWEKTNSQFKAGMLNAGITEKDFPFLQKGIEAMPDGKDRVTVEGIRAIDPAIVKDRASELGVSTQRYLSDLSYKYYSNILHGGQDSTTSSTFREKAATSFGQNKGTWQRGTLDLVMQFKQFYFQAANIAIKTLNMRPDEAKLARGVLQSSGDSYGDFGKLLVGTTAMGYAAMLLKEGVTSLSEEAWKATTGTEAFANHKSVDPRKIQTWVDAMNRGGAAGFYMDSLLGDNDKFSASQSIAGPTFGQLYDLSTNAIANLRKTAIDSAQNYLDTGSMQDPMHNAHGGLSSAVKSVVRDIGLGAKQMVPFGQFPIVKQALDYGFYNQLQESLTPGYVQKRQLKLQRQQLREGSGQ